MEDCINQMLTNYSKSYTQENNARLAVRKKLSEYDGKFKFAIINKDDKFFPVVIWKKGHEDLIMASVYAGFFTFNA